MKAVEGAGCIVDEDDATVTLVVEFRAWLDRERSLSPASVRCYGAQAKRSWPPSAVRMRSVSWTRARFLRSWWNTPGTATRGRRRRW